MNLTIHTKADFLKKDLVRDASDLYVLSIGIQDNLGEIIELNQVVDNLQFIADSVKNAKDSSSSLEALGMLGTVSELLGVASDKIDQKIAVEGLGQKIIDGIVAFWKKVKDFIEKCVKIVKAIFDPEDNDPAKNKKELEEAEKLLNEKKKDNGGSTESLNPSVTFSNMSVTVSAVSGPYHKEFYPEIRTLEPFAKKTVWPILYAIDAFAKDASKQTDLTKDIESEKKLESLLESSEPEIDGLLGKLNKAQDKAKEAKTYKDLGFTNYQEIKTALDICKEFACVNPMSFVKTDCDKALKNFGLLANTVINGREKFTSDESRAYFRRLGAVASKCSMLTRRIILLCRCSEAIVRGCRNGVIRMAKDWNKAVNSED